MSASLTMERGGIRAAAFVTAILKAFRVCGSHAAMVHNGNLKIAQRAMRLKESLELETKEKVARSRIDSTIGLADQQILQLQRATSRIVTP